MKKTIISFVLITAFVLLLTGCGSSSNNDSKKTSNESKDSKFATIVDNEGKTNKMEAKEVVSIANENEAKFKKYYVGAKISFDGTVDKVEMDKFSWPCYKNSTYYTSVSGIEQFTEQSKNDTSSCAEITFKDGYKLFIPSEGIIDVADIESGVKYHVESNIIMKWNSELLLYGVSEDRTTVDYFATKITK